MITTSEAFKQDIKANVVKAKARVVFNYDSPLTVTEIVGINVSHLGEVALGCVQSDKVDVEIRSGSISDELYGQDVKVRVEIGCNNEFVSIGTFKISRWQNNDYTITVQLVTDLDVDKEIKEVLAESNISLRDYIVKAVKVLIDKDVSADTVKDGQLELAYLYYKTVKEQLKALTVACGGLLRFRDTVELVPYYWDTPVAIYKESTGEMILDKTGNSADTLTTKKTYKVVKSVFTKEDDTSLYSATNVRVTDDYIPFTFSFSSPSLVSYITFAEYTYFNRFDYGLFGGTISLGSGYDGKVIRSSFTLYGSKISSNIIDATDDADTTYITNPYIQTSEQVSALQTDICSLDKYSFKSRIDPSLQIGDTITVYGKGDLLVTSISYKFDGSLTGTIEGVLKP